MGFRVQILALLLLAATAQAATPEHRKLVREHAVWYRHFPARIDEVWIKFAPKKKQMGRIIYSHGVLPPTSSLVTIAELEICAAIKSQEMPHDSIKYPLPYTVYQPFAVVGTLRLKPVPVASGALLSCS